MEHMTIVQAAVEMHITYELRYVVHHALGQTHLVGDFSYKYAAKHEETHEPAMSLNCENALISATATTCLGGRRGKELLTQV